MNNNWHKKEKPLLGLTGLGGGPDGLSVVGAASKTYIDELFSPYVYTGNGSARSISNGIDLSDKGGMVWIKKRNTATGGNSHIADTVRGITKYLTSNEDYAENTDANRTSATTSQGFSLGANNGTVNNNGDTYSSLTFAKKEGFFDIVSYTGNGTSQTISHSLKSIPGVIMIKNLSNTTNWVVYHRCGGVAQAVGGNYSYFTKLNTTASEVNNTNMITATPTASSFALGDNSDVNQNSNNYIAYIFAGGESTAATAKSIDVGSGDYLSIPDDDAWELGTTFTIEAWIRPDNFDDNYNTIVAQSNSSSGGWYFSVLGGGGSNEGKLQFHDFTGSGSFTTPFQHNIETKVWTHVAFVSNSGIGTWYVNGTAVFSSSGVNVGSGNGNLYIGNQTGSSWPWDGKISNLRIVKGTAVYTSSFKPPTEPLTNITNTVLLCCQSSTVTTATVSPGTITNSGVVASDRNPFDDPAGFKFGEGGDQNIIKTGEYLGRSTTLNPVVDLGWEPQFIMIKALTTTGPWLMYDCIRNVIVDENSPYLEANDATQETTNTSYIELTPTGFKIMGNYSDVNTSFETYGYIAIRRADGWVSKPADAGTSIFAMDYGNNVNGTMSNFDSGFPVDFALMKKPAASSDWYTGSRLTGMGYMKPNATTAESDLLAFKWQSNVGWNNVNYSSAWLSWMWKRGPGLDVVAYEGNSENSRIIRHSLGAAPDMMWIKNRDDTTDWIVGASVLDDGNEPWTHYLKLNTTDTEGDYDYFMDKAPTAYSFEVTTGSVNDTNKSYLALLFKSITGISKVGSFSGVASASYPLTVTTGFAPRFILIKARTGVSGYGWFIWDSLRYSGSDNLKLTLNTDGAQDSASLYQYFNDAPISGNSTGFTIVDNGWGSTSGVEFLYYAHA